MPLPPAVAGIIQSTTALPDGTGRSEAGLAYAVSGKLHVTPVVSASDCIQAGLRRSNEGALVIGPGEPAARPYRINGGWPSDNRPGREGVVIGQTGTPSPTDPLISCGYAVGALGGLYFSEL